MIKLIIRRILLLVCALIISPLILLTWLEKLLEYNIIGQKRGYVFSACGELLAICPSIIGGFLRLAYYWAVCTRISPDANIAFGCMITHRENMIRAGANLGLYTFVGFADIGENVIFGARVSIVSGKYQHGRPSQRVNGIDAEITEENEVIHIGKNSWIGQDVVIMANIGENCTVGAGSVVYRDVPDNTTVLGNPARKVSMEPLQ
jgi:virginiamycin A acetyltransferase